ncbi:hypothetical protein HYH03_004225 [Edaphochlamys debaryana]|uniref:Profilin n=1 Tax=Edaphochlamys debaryana TaxID=47281 RepID=A0A836C3R5_9CHLO|nr:hypothetical protein HYH03_004225 [Edaphochlamys debaryana]|eukprot:KAG2497964.1 hypothetical protein HYH03_004225 [Edaphochlamys debaryana]
MAWDAYISQNLMAPVDSAGNTLLSSALLGHDGGVWAKSADFPAITDGEVTIIMNAMNDNSITACNIAGVKYMKLQSDDKMLHCRKDKTGFIVRKTAQALVIGFYHDPPVPGAICNKQVDQLADYLEQQGY